MKLGMKLTFIMAEIKIVCKMGSFIHVTKNAQVASSLLQACYLAVIKPISGCVRIACSGLMITGLLQVVNMLAAI